MIKPGIYFYRYFAEDHLGNRGKTKTDTTVVIPVYPQAPIFPASHSIEVTAGDNFWIDIQVGTEQQPVENLFSASFILNYSNTLYVDVISQDSIEAGDFLGNNVNLSSQIDDQNGKITIDISRISGARNVDGYGKLVRIKYSSAPNTPDRTAIHFTIPEVTAADSAAYPIDLMPQDTTIWVVKPFSAFAMTIIPDSQSIHQGDSTNFIISFESLGVFDSQITMSITEIPVGMQIIFPSQPFDIPATDTITFATSDEITPGFYAPIITATGGGTTQVDTVIIKVLPKSIQPDFVMTVQPEHQTIHQGKSTDFTLSFHPTGEFDSQISLEISDLPSGMDATYPSDTFTIPTSFDVIFSTTVDIEPGIYHPIIKASGGGTTHQVRTKITVFQQADFIMIIEPDSQAVTAGDSIEFHISFIPVGGFNSQITVAVSNVPAGMDAIYTSGPFNIPLSIRVSFRTLRNIPLDVYHPTVTAASGGINHQETLAIKVLPAPLIIQNFSVQPNPFTPNNDGYNDFVEFQYPDPSSGGVSISIFDVNGRKIIEIRNSRYWYGKDDKGRDVKPGAYIYVVKDRDKVMAKGVIALAR